MKIEVLNRPAEQVETTWDGVTRTRSKQWATIEIDGLATPFQVTSDPGKEYAPGPYELAPTSITVQNGRLTIQRVVLVPKTPAKAPAAPARV